MVSPVTDPALLAQLEGNEPQPVTDPELLVQLNGPQDHMLVRTLKGGKHAMDRAAYGLEKLITGEVAPEHQAEIKAGRAYDEQAGLPATIGGIAFDALATPAGKAKLLPAIAGGMGYGALSSTAEDRALYGAALGGAGSAIGGMLGKTLGRVANPTGPITEGAQKLLDQGVPLTPGQAGSPGMQVFESYLAKVPFLGKTITSRQKEAGQAVASKVAEQVGARVPPNATGQQLVDAVQGKVADDYATAIAAIQPDFRSAFAVNSDMVHSNLSKVTGVHPAVLRSIASDISKSVQNIKAAKSTVEAGRLWKETDATIGAAVAANPNKAGLQAVQQAWRSAFHTAAGPNASQKLLNADLTYRQAEALTRAIGVKQQATPTQLAQALRRQNIDPDNVMSAAGRYSTDVGDLGQRVTALDDLAHGAETYAQPQKAPWVLPQVASAMGLGAAYGGVAGAAIPALTGMGATGALYSKKLLPYTTGQLLPEQEILAQLLREGYLQQGLRKAGAGYMINEGE